MVPSNGPRGSALFASQARSSQASQPPSGTPDAQPASAAQSLPPGDVPQVNTRVAPDAEMPQSLLAQLKEWAHSSPSELERISPFADAAPPGFDRAIARFFLNYFESGSQPPEATGSDGPGGTSGAESLVDTARRTALFSAATVGGAFSVAFRVGEVLAGNPHPGVRAAARVLPLIAAAVTPGLGKAVTDVTGLVPSKTSSLWEDAAGPLGIGLVMLAKKRCVPPGPLATMVSPIIGSGLGGAAQAAAVHASRPGSGSAASASTGVPITTRDQALGNAAAVTPFVAAGAMASAAGKPLPWALATTLLLGGWTGRRVLADEFAQRGDGGAKKECLVLAPLAKAPAKVVEVGN